MVEVMDNSAAATADFPSAASVSAPAADAGVAAGMEPFSLGADSASLGSQTDIERSKKIYVAPDPDDDTAAPKKGGAAYLFIKRVFDICFSSLACVILAIPVMVACIAIVIDSPGVPVFKQERIGKDGKHIFIYKLRTMVVDAHDHPEKYMTLEQLEIWKREQKLDNDPRVTKVGRFLRRTSLDEVMQFLNVISGDLSIIGPRPVTLSETYEYGDAREEVLSCKPGITGWWAVTDRNDATWENGDRQSRELFYVRHASLALDARVFVRTFKAMGRGK